MRSLIACAVLLSLAIASEKTSAAIIIGAGKVGSYEATGYFPAPTASGSVFKDSTFGIRSISGTSNGINSYLYFDLSSISDTITAVQLQLGSPDPSGGQTVPVFLVEGAVVTDIIADSGSAAVYNALQSGTQVSTISTAASTSLNALAIDSAKANAFVLGLSITEQNVGSAFSSDNLAANAQLSITTLSSVPEPSSFAVFGIVLVGGVLARRRNRNSALA